jgi:hypothetical protein
MKRYSLSKVDDQGPILKKSYNRNLQILVFVPGKLFQPSLMYEEPTLEWSTWEVSKREVKWYSLSKVDDQGPVLYIFYNRNLQIFVIG